MKADLDRLMAERDLDAVIVLGDSSGNTVMNYLTGGVHLERAVIFKRKGEPLTLIHGGMERDTAAETGLALIDRDQRYNTYTLLEKHDGDRLAAEADYLQQVVADHNLRGRLGVYGMQDAGGAFALLSAVQAALADTELVGEYDESIFTVARETKDDHELAELKEAGRLTCAVVGETQAFLQHHRVEDEVLVKADGTALTVGDVKSYMRERLRHYGMDDHGHTIFSIGREAGVPHNRGSTDAPIRLGHTIVFDIFPQTPSGYYHDMTRTWCLGYAPDDVQQAWDEVQQVFDKVMAEYKVGRPCRDYQEITLDYFESKGHPTTRTHPGTHEGYVHSLGHGIGLDIHEEPRLTHAAGYTNDLQPGHVVTVEPGLYYPEKGYGIRIEDAVAFNEAGELVWLTEYPYDLVIPMLSPESAAKTG